MTEPAKPQKPPVLKLSGSNPSSGNSRRSFFKDSGLLLAGGAFVGGNLTLARAAHAYGSDIIKIGLIGCGGRGSGAAVEALNTGGGEVHLAAMADIFGNNLQTAYRSIKGKHPSKVFVSSETRFVGLDAFEKLLATDVDLVILATPPGFRPLHFEAAVHAGKHVFMEKPVAVDAPGVRRVLAAGDEAQKRGLAVHVGLQRHHEIRYRQCIERLHDGAIGKPLFARAYWNGAGLWTRPRRPEQTELEYQLNNWYYFNWLSGDHINEQHVHNLDVINWAMQSYPIEAQGQGGREVRRGANTGQIFDHHMVEFTYPGGARLLSQCRHIPGCGSSVGEHLHGTHGYCDLSAARIFDLDGNLVWESDAKEISGRGWQQEHHDLIAALRSGERPNETQYGALSTMTAIMGRMATYSGKTVKWEQALNSNLALANVDSLRSFSDLPPLMPNSDGGYEVPVPGKSVVL
jgi:myo-inositol 2-dehydrogenase / D-chiro-inositol 1-dehydrogenase